MAEKEQEKQEQKAGQDDQKPQDEKIEVKKEVIADAPKDVEKALAKEVKERKEEVDMSSWTSDNQRVSLEAVHEESSSRPRKRPERETNRLLQRMLLSAIRMVL